MEKFALVDLNDNRLLDDLSDTELLGLICDVHYQYKTTQNIQLVGFYIKITKMYNGRRGGKYVKEYINHTPIKRKNHGLKNSIGPAVPMCSIRTVVDSHGQGNIQSQPDSMECVGDWTSDRLAVGNVGDN